MALRFSYDQPTGQSSPQAHCVVTDVKVPKIEERTPGDEEGEEIISKRFHIEYSCLFYANEAAYEAGLSPVGGWNGNFDFADGNSKNQYNIVKQIYLHMKTLSEFENAEDC